MPTEVQEATLTIYAVHDFIDPRPLALLLNRDDAQGVAENYPRSFIHEVSIARSRWISLDELKPELIGAN